MPCMIWTKMGLLIAGPDGVIKLFAVVSKRRHSIARGPAPQEPAWRLAWSAAPQYFLNAFCVSDSSPQGVYACTVRSELYKLAESQMVQFKNYGAEVIDFDFLYPSADLVCTINDFGNLLFWDREKGYMVGGLRVGRGCMSVRCGPVVPLVAVGRSDGALLLVSGERPHRPRAVAEVVLCADAIDWLEFSFSGKHLLAVSRNTGQLFVVKAPPCEKVFIMAYCNLDKPIADLAMSEVLPKHMLRVVVLLKKLSCCGAGGPEMYVYNVHVHDAAELTKQIKLKFILQSSFSYVSLAACPARAQQLLAAPHRSRQIHVFLFENEYVHNPRLVEVIPSGHQIRGISVAFCGGDHPELRVDMDDTTAGGPGTTGRTSRRQWGSRRSRAGRSNDRVSSRASQGSRASRASRASSRPSQASSHASSRVAGSEMAEGPSSYTVQEGSGAGALFLTCGRDGMILLRSGTNMMPLTGVVAHHRVDGGVLRALVDPLGRSMLSLGRDGVLVCTHLTPLGEDAEEEEGMRGFSGSTALSGRSRRTLRQPLESIQLNANTPSMTPGSDVAPEAAAALPLESLQPGKPIDEEVRPQNGEEEEEEEEDERASQLKKTEPATAAVESLIDKVVKESHAAQSLAGDSLAKKSENFRGSLGRKHKSEQKSVQMITVDDRTDSPPFPESPPAGEIEGDDAGKRSLTILILQPEYKLIGTEKGVNWLQFQQNVKGQEEVLSYGGSKKNIMNQLRDLRAQVSKLLDANESGPPEERLPISVFDMDVQGRERKAAMFRLELNDIITRIRAEMAVKDKLTSKIKSRTWDLMTEQSRRIHAFLGEFFVENYVLFVPNQPEAKQLEILEKRLRITTDITREDTFFPWMVNQDYDMVREASVMYGLHHGSSNLAEIAAADSSTSVQDEDRANVFSGSSSYMYTTPSSFHCTQFELCTYQHIHQEVILLQKITTDLQTYFNTEFDKVFATKDTELGLLADKNKRRRHLLTELAIEGVNVEDLQWNPFEEPGRLMSVAENEVSVSPYLTKSEEELRERLAAEREAERLRLLADDFRERALIAMMHGVLELRWEDKIKRDVPRPKCMTDKPPEEWNEEDIRAVRDYDEKVLLLMQQRRLYRKMCAKEYENIMQVQRENMLKFDKKLHELLELKMKVQACIDEENLKILQGRMKIYERLQLEEKEKRLLAEVAATEEEGALVSHELSELAEAKRECRAAWETAQTRDRTLERSFRREFRDMHHAIRDALHKLFKRRPKVQHRAALSGALADALARCVSAGTSSMSGDAGKPSYLPHESIEFLHALDDLDAYVNAPHSVLESDWVTFCRLRRHKIECELKVKSIALQLAECDATISVFNKRLAVLKEKLMMLGKSLKDVLEEELEAAHNIKIQLVMKQGLVEIPDDYEIGDFRDCVLINRSVVQNINSLILEAGEKKLNAMHQLTNFHRVVMCKEWEHKKMRMEIEDLETKLRYVDSVKLTREMQLLLRHKKLGMPMESVKETLDKQIAAYKQVYDKIVRIEKEKLAEVTRHIRKMKKEGHDLDKQITNVNVDVNEMTINRDYAFEEEQERLQKYRMKLIVRRAEALRAIQRQHHEMLLLQTELELRRLRTFPTLKYSLCDYLCF